MSIIIALLLWLILPPIVILCLYWLVLGCWWVLNQLLVLCPGILCAGLTAVALEWCY
jgi:hypothetical protein